MIAFFVCFLLLLQKPLIPYRLACPYNKKSCIRRTQMWFRLHVCVGRFGSVFLAQSKFFRGGGFGTVVFCLFVLFVCFSFTNSRTQHNQ